MDLQQIEALLKKSIALDPTSWPRRTCNWAISTRTRPSTPRPFRNMCGRANLSPDLADVHYRLGQAYVHTEQTETVRRQQFQVYQRLRAEHLAEVDKQRADIRQFVYSAKDGQTAK